MGRLFSLAVVQVSTPRILTPTSWSDIPCPIPVLPLSARRDCRSAWDLGSHLPPTPAGTLADEDWEPGEV